MHWAIVVSGLIVVVLVGRDRTSDDNSPAHVTVNGYTENKTIQTSSIPQIRNIQTTSVAFASALKRNHLQTIVIGRDMYHVGSSHFFWYWYLPGIRCSRYVSVFFGWYCCTENFSGNTFLSFCGNSFFEKFRGNPLG